MLEVAADCRRALLDDLEPALEKEWSVGFVEPSDASMTVDGIDRSRRRGRAGATRAEERTI